MNQPAERTIILHYHLFKNAGTSVDEILKHNFGDKWVTREFPSMGKNNTELVEEWIRATPEAIAYSSHTMQGPLPAIDGVKIISFMLLRDPIERILSAYKHEATEHLSTPAVLLAKCSSLQEYVAFRLQNLGDRQCRNFHVYWLGSLCIHPGATELELAKLGLTKLSIIGRVESFMEAMNKLKAAVITTFPHFHVFNHATNLSKFREKLAPSPEFIAYLTDINRQDFELLGYYEATLERRFV